MQFNNLFNEVYEKHPSEYMKFHKERFNKLFSKVMELHSAKILDIGESEFTHILHNSGFDVDVLKKKDCDLEKDSIPYLPETFDLIVYTEVIEHLKSNYAGTLKEMFRILRLGGYILFGTPNKNSLWKILRLSKVALFHVKEFSKKACNDLVKVNGFKIISSTYESYLDYTKKDLMHFLYFMVVMMIPPFRESILIVARK